MRLLAWLFLLASLSAFAAEPNVAALSWEQAPSNCNGTPYIDPAGFKIYYGTVGRAGAGLPLNSTVPLRCDQMVQASDPRVRVAYQMAPIVLSDPALRSYSITFQQPGRWYFAVTAFNLAGEESPLSNEASKDIVLPVLPVLTFSGASCANCTPTTGALLVGVTGQDVSVAWGASPGTTPDRVEAELHLYPVRTAAIPIARATLAPAASGWSFRPGRSELYYVRIRACNSGGCGAWSNSFDQGWLFYFRLAPASGGGID